jgi:DNA-binding NarL/FixJ family response regulator
MSESGGASDWTGGPMYLQASTPLVNVRRSSRYGVHYRQRHGRSFRELITPQDETWDVHPSPSLRIALIDPKPLTRVSLLKMLGASLPEHVKLLGVSSFGELIDPVELGTSFSLQPDLNLAILYVRSAAVTDNWVQEQLNLIRTQQPGLPVIMISDRDDADDIISALNYGVRGYIPTSIAAEVAIAALTLIEAGGTYVPVNALRSEGVEVRGNSEDGVEVRGNSEDGVEVRGNSEDGVEVRGNSEHGVEVRSNSEDGEQAHVSGQLNLTTRELAVIDLLREGNANKVIARKLNMRESTVKVHVRNILKKLRVSNRTHAATVANRLLANGQAIRAADDPPVVIDR